MGKGQRAEENRIQDSEDRGIGANSDGEDSGANHSQAGTAHEGTKSEPEILCEFGKHRPEFNTFR